MGNIKEAEYEHKNKSTGNTQFYRFTSPKSKEYPFMIEIFSKKPEFIVLDENAVLTPLPIDDEICNLIRDRFKFCVNSKN